MSQIPQIASPTPQSNHHSTSEILPHPTTYTSASLSVTSELHRSVCQFPCLFSSIPCQACLHFQISSYVARWRMTVRKNLQNLYSEVHSEVHSKVRSEVHLMRRGCHLNLNNGVSEMIPWT